MVLIGMLLALIGGTIVGLSDSCSFTEFPDLQCLPISIFLNGTAFWGDILALAGAFAAAGYLLIGRNLRENMSLIPYIFLVYGVAAVILVFLVLVSGESPLGQPRQAYLWFLLLALVPQLLGHSTFNWVLGYLPAAFVSVTLLGEPVGSAILAYFILGEVPTPLMVFGAILILVGIFIASLREDV
jgi:drug/metabolite transporter (DMT)-like permease